MADRRLVWNQVQAPDLSAASAALARANESFRGGFESANTALDAYTAGQVEKAEQDLFAELAALGTEEEFDKFVDKGGLNNRNISEALRKDVLNMRTGFVADEGVRSRTGLTNAQAANRVAQNQRDSLNYDYQTKQRDELAGLSGLLVDARTEGRNAGQYGDASAKERYRNAVASIESDGSGGYRAIGATHPELGRALGRYQIMEANLPQWSQEALGRQVSVEEFMENDDIQDAIFDHKFGGYVEKYGEENAARAWFGGEGGINKPNRTDVHGRVNISDYGKNFMAALGRTPSRPADDAFREALASSETLTPTQIDALLGQSNTAKTQGQTLLDDVESRAKKEGTELVKEMTANILNDVIGSPEVLTDSQFDNAIRNHPLTQHMTESEILEAVAAGANLRSSDAGQNILRPDIPGTPELDVNVANTIAAADASLRSTDQNRAIGDIEQFAEDPAAQLEAAVGLATDKQSAGFLGGVLSKGQSGYDQNHLRNMINDYAQRLGVEPPIVAVAMRDAFKRDPFTFLGFNANTLENRFEFEDVKEAVKQLDQESIRAYRERRSNNELMEIELTALQTQAANLQRQIEKSSSSAQKAALTAQLDALNTQVARIEQRRQNNKP